MESEFGWHDLANVSSKNKVEGVECGMVVVCNSNKLKLVESELCYMHDWQVFQASKIDRWYSVFIW